MAVMQNECREIDECLESLWTLREKGVRSLRGLSAEQSDGLEESTVRRAEALGLASFGDQGEFTLSPEGETRARRLVRSHRIAERLIHDVLGSTPESVACEFEHLVNTEVVDSICTLLGHPKECPHGHPIPPGECCRCREKVVRQRIRPLTQLAVGQSGRIAYIYTKAEDDLHTLESLQVRPGVVVTLHQRYPSFVVECEGGSIALEEKMAANINVWLAGEQPSSEEPAAGAPEEKRRWFGRKRRGGGR